MAFDGERILSISASSALRFTPFFHLLVPYTSTTTTVYNCLYSVVLNNSVVLYCSTLLSSGAIWFHFFEEKEEKFSRGTNSGLCKLKPVVLGLCRADSAPVMEKQHGMQEHRSKVVNIWPAI